MNREVALWDLGSSCLQDFKACDGPRKFIGIMTLLDFFFYLPPFTLLLLLRSLVDI